MAGGVEFDGLVSGAAVLGVASLGVVVVLLAGGLTGAGIGVAVSPVGGTVAVVVADGLTGAGAAGVVAEVFTAALPVAAVAVVMPADQSRVARCLGVAFMYELSME